MSINYKGKLLQVCQRYRTLAKITWNRGMTQATVTLTPLPPSTDPALSFSSEIMPRAPVKKIEQRACELALADEEFKALIKRLLASGQVHVPTKRPKLPRFDVKSLPVFPSSTTEPQTDAGTTVMTTENENEYNSKQVSVGLGEDKRLAGQSSSSEVVQPGEFFDEEFQPEYYADFEDRNKNSDNKNVNNPALALASSFYSESRNSQYDIRTDPPPEAMEAPSNLHFTCQALHIYITPLYDHIVSEEKRSGFMCSMEFRRAGRHVGSATSKFYYASKKAAQRACSLVAMTEIDFDAEREEEEMSGGSSMSRFGKRSAHEREDSYPRRSRSREYYSRERDRSQGHPREHSRLSYSHPKDCQAAHSGPREPYYFDLRSPVVYHETLAPRDPRNFADSVKRVIYNPVVPSSSSSEIDAYKQSRLIF